VQVGCNGRGGCTTCHTGLWWRSRSVCIHTRCTCHGRPQEQSAAKDTVLDDMLVRVVCSPSVFTGIITSLTTQFTHRAGPPSHSVHCVLESLKIENIRYVAAPQMVMSRAAPYTVTLTSLFVVDDVPHLISQNVARPSVAPPSRWFAIGRPFLVCLLSLRLPLGQQQLHRPTNARGPGIL
jgi:hypothetical protein